MVYKKWNYTQPDPEKSALLQSELGEGRLLCDVLVSRGLDTAEKAEAFLSSRVELPDPLSITDMAKAAARIHEAVDNGEPMVIFGDYDVDGITATALLYTYLESLGAEVFYKLPSRSVDEYGLTESLVDQVADHGISLIITVDNGTSALGAARRAAERGVDVVMTDHHLPPDTLPEVAALVNPCRADDESLCGNLSGVGVAFMLVAAMEILPAQADSALYPSNGEAEEPPAALLPEQRQEIAADLLPMFGDLVAVGTVADVMHLTGANRVLVREGLAALQDTQRPGLAALIDACGLADKQVTVEHISFILAPRLNAAGRMDDATEALKLMLADSTEEAIPLVEGLIQQNEARQKQEQEILAEIVAGIEADEEKRGARVLVVWGDGWHQGIIGIVASRLVDRYAKPAIVISFEGDDGRGSGRSIAGFSLYGAVASCEDILVRFGGHNLAAGLSIRREHLSEFSRRVNAWAAENYPLFPVPELAIDAKISLPALTVAEVRSLDRLAPCGNANPQPKFLLENASLDAVYSVGEGRHSRLRFVAGGASLTAVLFGTGPSALAYKPGMKVDVLLTLSIYEGRGEPQVSARIVELRPAGLGNAHVDQSALFSSFTTGGAPTAEQKGLLFPSREDTAAVYRAVRDGGEVYYSDARPLFARLGEELTGRALTSLAALEELGLIARDEASGQYRAEPVAEKKDLASSVLLRRLEVS